MPALEHFHESRPVLGHVNLMLDSFIANAQLDDLRAVVRTTLATSPPSVTLAFTTTARRHLERANARAPACGKLFMKTAPAGLAVPAPELHGVLSRARTLYGAGMGFASLKLLTQVVRATVGARWDEDGETADRLAAIDADITQAIQSAKEEMAGGRVADGEAARAVVVDLHAALQTSSRDVEEWGGEYPFERAGASVVYWKI
ncbi:hypothetical protein B0H21DRAFT_424762 [Amylocystis lapponica]|nr:hypothetical protein B0H21DRAFT_424762 [Amylocystis lapponica]